MQLIPRFEILPVRTLVGLSDRMSIAKDGTPALWQKAMPLFPSVPNRIGTDLFSVEVYDDLSFFEQFDPTREFQKWAAVLVGDPSNIPDGFDVLAIPDGEYAVFPFKGSAKEAPAAYQFIYNIWLKESESILEDRPHFAVMSAAYRPDDPNAEEEIWVPVKRN